MKRFIIREDTVKLVKQALSTAALHFSKCSYVDDDMQEEIDKAYYELNVGLCLVREEINGKETMSKL